MEEGRAIERERNPSAGSFHTILLTASTPCWHYSNCPAELDLFTSNALLLTDKKLEKCLRRQAQRVALVDHQAHPAGRDGLLQGQGENFAA